jgi:hypothetical protein
VNNERAEGCTSVFSLKAFTAKELGTIISSYSSQACTMSCEEARDFLSKIGDEEGVPIESVSRSNLYRAVDFKNSKATKSFVEHFCYFESFVQELMTDNENSVNSFEIIEDPDGNPRFGRCALVLHAEAILASNCKPIISLDGGYLSGQWGSYQILVAATQDGDHNDCSIGIAIVPVESEDSYAFFINTMRKHPELKEFLDQPGLVVTSDRNKGLLNAVKNMLPNSYHRYCALHLLGNIKKGREFNDSDRNLYWSIVYSRNQVEFEENMKKLKEQHYEAYEYLFSLGPENWCDFAFPGPSFGHVTNNLLINL